MTVGSFRAKYNTPCGLCHELIEVGSKAWFEKGLTGYWCDECNSKKAEAQDAPRLSPIEQAHNENMESAKRTRDMMGLLVVQMQGLSDNIHALVEFFKEAKR